MAERNAACVGAQHGSSSIGSIQGQLCPSPGDTWRVAIVRAGGTRGGSAQCTQGASWPWGMLWESVVQ